MERSEDNLVRVSESKLLQFVKAAFVNAGVKESVAEQTAKGLVSASLRGVDSHGVRLLPHYLTELERGRINPNPVFELEQTAPAVGLLDADDSYGIAAGMEAMEHAMDLAEDAGAGHISVRNSSHNGMMAYFSLAAAGQDFIGFSTTHTSSNTRPPNSTRPFFGSNPICVAAPMMDEDPFCFDAATSATTFNEVRKARDSDAELPPNSAADAGGIETRNPHEATQLLPFGGYKGFGLSMVIEVLNGLLSGMPAAPNVSEMYGESISEPRELGHYYSVIRIDAFVETEEFKQRLQEMAERVRSEPRINDDLPNIIPGDPEKAAKKDRTQYGIPIPNHDLTNFAEIADTYGIEPLCEEIEQHKTSRSDNE